MAKLCVAYTLCPLIDQRSLLGVCEDSENGHVIVTLGKNIVVRYKLVDQKQVSSWSSKDKFTSCVIYDGEKRQYVSVTNQNQLRMWKETQQQLDKVKKMKFEQQIHCLLPQPGMDPSLVVFSNGTVSTLDEALSNRKLTKEPADSDEVMQDCQLISHKNNNYVTFLTVTPSETDFHIISPGQPNANLKFRLKRNDLVLRGHTILKDEDLCYLYTLWSDGQLFSLRLFSEHQPDSPGSLVQILTGVSTKHTVSMTALSSSHIAMYGADISEEGAILVIFNTRFRLIQARQRSKLFGIAPRLWCIGLNLFVASGNFLTVVPYRLEVARLAALVGSHKPEERKMKKAVWGFDQNPVAIISPPEIIDKKFNQLSTRGWSQAAIFNEILPDLIKTKDSSTIVWCLMNLEDISENCVVELLNFGLSESDTTFNKVSEKQIEMEVDDAESVKPVMELSRGKKRFLNAIMNVPFSDVMLIPHLRSMSLSSTLVLLDYLAKRLTNSDDVKAMEWLGLVLDSHYQAYLLSKDPKVIDILKSLRTLIHTHVSIIGELKCLEPVLQKLSVGKSVIKRSQLGNKFYSIEVLQLY